MRRRIRTTRIEIRDDEREREREKERERERSIDAPPPILTVHQVDAGHVNRYRSSLAASNPDPRRPINLSIYFIIHTFLSQKTSVVFNISSSTILLYSIPPFGVQGVSVVFYTPLLPWFRV